MKAVKISGAIGGATLMLFLFANFSAVESRFQCHGKISTTDGSHPGIVYLKLLEYRWWVGLWHESAGDVTLEVQNRPLVDMFVLIKKSGDLLLIYDYEQRSQGYFSTLSKTLAITTSRYSFDGTCKHAEK